MKPENGYIVDIAALKVRDGEGGRPLRVAGQPGQLDHRSPDPWADRCGRRQGADRGRGPAQVRGLGRHRAGRGPQRRVRPPVRAAPPARTTWSGHPARSTTRSSWPTSCTPMPAATSSASSSASSSARIIPAAHRAMPDAEATAELFISLTGNLVERLDAIRADIAAEVRRGKEAYNRTEQGQALEDVRRRHGIGSALDGRPDQGHRPRARPVGEHPGRRARHDHHSTDLGRGRDPAAHPWLGPLHPRPDPGPLDRHARTVERRPAAGHDLPGDREAVHAPLQLPALLGG